MRQRIDLGGSMRCNYCKKAVLGASPITVPGLGPAHEICYQTHLVRKRIFSGLNIAALDDQQLAELSDLVLMEKNARMSEIMENTEEFEIELF